jgi:hypothetical protein
MSAQLKLLKFESQEDDNIDQVLMVVPEGYDKDLAHETAEGCLGPCMLVAVAYLDLSHPTANALDTDFDAYRPYTG